MPAIGSLVADPIMGLVDTAVVGRLGADELGALGLSVALLAALSWVFNFLVFGTTAVVARAVGGGDRVAAGRRVSHAAQVALALGIAVAALLLVAAPRLLALTGAVPALIEPGATYLRIRAVGVPFFLLGYVGHGAFRGVADTRTPLVVAILGNLVNLGLTLWLVFGLGWGVAGAAWGTVAAEVLIVVLFAALLARVGLPLAGHGRPDRAQLGELLVVSRDLFLRSGALVLGLFLVSAAAARLSAVTAAAHQVIWQTWIIISFLMDGFAIAGQAIVGNALGAGDVDEARGAARDLVWWGVGGGIVIAGLLLLGAQAIPQVLTDEPAVLAAVATAWALASVGHVLSGVVFVLDGVLMGAGDFAYLRTWTVAAAVVAGLGAQIVASLGGGLLGLWLAVTAMIVVRFASVAVRVRQRAWTTTGPSLPSAS